MLKKKNFCKINSLQYLFSSNDSFYFVQHYEVSRSNFTPHFFFFLLLFQLVIGCQSARKTTERRVLRLSGEEESGQFSGAEDNDLEDTRGRPMQKTDTNDDSRTGSSSGHSSGHMSHQTEISGNNSIEKKLLKRSTLLST